MIQTSVKLLLGGFLLIYVMTVVGNLGDDGAHPHGLASTGSMCLFLSPSFLDTCYSSVVTPWLPGDFLASGRSVSFKGPWSRRPSVMPAAAESSCWLPCLRLLHGHLPTSPLGSVMTRALSPAGGCFLARWR